MGKFKVFQHRQKWKLQSKMKSVTKILKSTYFVPSKLWLPNLTCSYYDWVCIVWWEQGRSVFSTVDLEKTSQRSNGEGIFWRASRCYPAMRKQNYISGNAKNMSQGTLVELRTACSKKTKLSARKPEPRSKEKACWIGRLQDPANGHRGCDWQGPLSGWGWRTACAMFSKGTVYPTAERKHPEYATTLCSSHKGLLCPPSSPQGVSQFCTKAWCTLAGILYIWSDNGRPCKLL